MGLSTESIYERTAWVLGKEALEKIETLHILICGLGGVGSFVAESLYRTGVRHMTLVDDDIIEASNFNRQLIATVDTLGKLKVDACVERLEKIDPSGSLCKRVVQINEETAPGLFLEGAYDFVIDAIDDISAKLMLAALAAEKNIPFISAMGCGNKLDPGFLSIKPLHATRICPLARIMRKKASKQALDFMVCYSEEKVTVDAKRKEAMVSQRKVPVGSLIFVPGAAGLMIASYVIRQSLLTT